MASAAQIESVKVVLRAVDRYGEDKILSEFCQKLADVMEEWQRLTPAGKNPANHPIIFGRGAGKTITATLLQIMALLPEEYQKWIVLDVLERYLDPSVKVNAAWLSEHVLNVLVTLSPREENVMFFARGMAADINDDMDTLARGGMGLSGPPLDSYLEFLVNVMQAGEPEKEWNPNGYYTIPCTSKGVSLFWNYTTAHWLTIYSELRPRNWKHTIYNSFDRGKKGPSWRAPLKYIPKLEKLIQAASGISERLNESVFEMGVSAQQLDGNDCGVFATYNCVELLNGRVPCVDVDARTLRLAYLGLVLNALRGMEIEVVVE